MDLAAGAVATAPVRQALAIEREDFIDHRTIGRYGCIPETPAAPKRQPECAQVLPLTDLNLALDFSPAEAISELSRGQTQRRRHGRRRHGEIATGVALDAQNSSVCQCQHRAFLLDDVSSLARG